MALKIKLGMLALVFCLAGVAWAGDHSMALAHMEEGRKLEAAKDYKGALAEYKKALEEDSTVSDAHYRMGNCYHNLGEYAKASQEYDKFLAANPPKDNAAAAAAAKIPTEYSYSGVVYMDPLGIAAGAVNIGMEIGAGDTNSFKAVVAYEEVATPAYLLAMFGLNGAYDFYFDAAHPQQGFFAGPEISMLYLHSLPMDNYYFGLGVEGGYKLKLPFGFVIMPEARIGYQTDPIGRMIAVTAAFKPSTPSYGASWATSYSDIKNSPFSFGAALNLGLSF